MQAIFFEYVLIVGYIILLITLMIAMIDASAEKRTFDTDTIEINDGTKDVSSVPSKLILLRQLDHLSTEESIFESVQSLHGVQRAILIRDKMTKMSCEFAFVEFENVQVNSRLLTTLKKKSHSILFSMQL